jgi:hypothetical protein
MTSFAHVRNLEAITDYCQFYFTTAFAPEHPASTLKAPVGVVDTIEPALD